MRFFKQLQLEMVRRVALFLKRNKMVLCMRVAALEGLTDDMVATAESMDDHYRSQEFRKTNRQTSKKKIVKAELLKAIDRLARGATAYAYKRKDTEMIKNIDFSHNQLNKGRVEQTADRCKAIIEAAKSISEIGHYGIKPEHISLAEKCYEEFREVMRSPEQRRKERANEREYLEYLLKECIYQLETQIDRLVELATEDDFQLRYSYKEVRKVFPAGQGRKTEKEKRYLASRKRKPKM